MLQTTATLSMTLIVVVSYLWSVTFFILKVLQVRLNRTPVCVCVFVTVVYWKRSLTCNLCPPYCLPLSRAPYIQLFGVGVMALYVPPLKLGALSWSCPTVIPYYADILQTQVSSESGFPIHNKFVVTSSFKYDLVLGLFLANRKKKKKQATQRFERKIQIFLRTKKNTPM